MACLCPLPTAHEPFNRNSSAEEVKVPSPVFVYIFRTEHALLFRKIPYNTGGRRLKVFLRAVRNGGGSRRAHTPYR
jgi:hypothetical protein